LNERGFSFVELAVIVTCVGIVTGLLLQRVLPLMRIAEKTAFEQVRGQLASAVLLEAAGRVARGESASLEALDGSNPMELLLEQPAIYAGSVAGGDHGEVPRRSWYFDENAGLLFYRPGSRVAQSAPGADGIALRVRFTYRDRDGDGHFDAVRDRFDGLALDQAGSFTRGVD
jgi:type II secretory pathway pseudopilin PulG